MFPITVFVCSTYADLSDERGAVLDAIRRLQLQHDSMEFFGARANQPIETCLDEVRRSNVLVVVVGHRYGTLVTGLGISFSEAEYREGHRLGKPCLVYMRGDDVPVLPKHVERDPEKLALLETWKSLLQQRHTIANFKESNDLALQVAADLGRTLSEIREASRAREEARAEYPIPALEEVARLFDDARKGGAPEQVLLSAIRRAISESVSQVQHLGPAIFFSYSNSDRDLVRQVTDGLSNAGMRVWMEEANLKAAESSINEVERALDSADFIIFFMSPRSLSSGWPQRELQIALHRQVSGERGATILPVLLEKSDVPPLLRDIHWVDLTDGDVPRAVDELATAINHSMMLKKVIHATPTDEHVRKAVSEGRILAVLEEERGVVGRTARRLGLSPKRLYQLLKHYNIQARSFR
jgi:hypothetical protein